MVELSENESESESESKIVYGTRASPQTHGTPSNSKKPIEKRKPKLWEVWLDDHYCSFKRLGGAMRDWQPVAVWTDDRPTHHNPRKTCFQEPVIDHHVAMAQAWFRDTYPFHPEHSIRLPSPHPPAPLLVSDRRTINVAVLVAMPSRRLEASPECVMTSHHTIGPRVSYGDGQLLMGVTSLPSPFPPLKNNNTISTHYGMATLAAAHKL
ncbi:hypothetical protein B0F90DRAFT_1667608 [Multifurca ochricompacta]|uniref:Uncharacterized protein n=1 Tax=Multifurca ochricompacta TaxID=376703 RepID=A0AAD4M6R6_9AGAM|nr:hypothetical protein B0F90DRAFT_1667608 [Multifurca ochricompacta]